MLFKAYTENESIQNLVKSQGELAQSNNERYGSVEYLIPKEDWWSGGWIREPDMC